MYDIHIPLVLQINTVKFYVYFNDHGVAHCHVVKDDSSAVILIKAGICVEVTGFSKKDVNRLEKIVLENAETLLDAWEEFNE
jgi:hypothetical protein